MKTAIILVALLGMTCSFSIFKTVPTPSYSVAASQQYVKLAAVAFCDGCLSSWTCKTSSEMKMTDILYIDQPVTKVHGYVGYRPDTQEIIASFRGSNNWENWAEDFVFDKIDYPDCIGCQIHSGFYGDFLSIQKQVKAHLDLLTKKYPTASMVTTGHSLGAAMAVICALSMKLHFPKLKIQIHNFGQPRVGNAKLAKFITQKVDGITRVVHNKDIVPHLPPDMLEYEHTPYEIFFNEDMTSYKICNSSGQDKSCSNKFFPNYDPNDHDHYFMYISHVQC